MQRILGLIMSDILQEFSIPSVASIFYWSHSTTVRHLPCEHGLHSPFFQFIDFYSAQPVQFISVIMCHWQSLSKLTDLSVNMQSILGKYFNLISLKTNFSFPIKTLVEYIEAT